MVRETARQKLTSSLTEVIDNWLSDIDEMEYPAKNQIIEWVGNRAGHLMATAAIAVLESQQDLLEYIRNEGMTVEELQP